MRDPASRRLDARRQSFTFRGHTDVKEIALYVQDTITKGNWSFNLGIRGDLYRGLESTSQAEPRLGLHTTLSNEYGAANFLRANSRDPFQRESRCRNDGLQRRCDCCTHSMRAGKFTARL